MSRDVKVAIIAATLFVATIGGAVVYKAQQDGVWQFPALGHFGGSATGWGGAPRATGDSGPGHHPNTPPTPEQAAPLAIATTDEKNKSKVLAAAPTEKAAPAAPPLVAMPEPDARPPVKSAAESSALAPSPLVMPPAMPSSSDHGPKPAEPLPKSAKVAAEPPKAKELAPPPPPVLGSADKKPPRPPLAEKPSRAIPREPVAALPTADSAPAIPPAAGLPVDKNRVESAPTTSAPSRRELEGPPTVERSPRTRRVIPAPAALATSRPEVETPPVQAPATTRWAPISPPGTAPALGAARDGQWQDLGGTGSPSEAAASVEKDQRADRFRDPAAITSAPSRSDATALASAPAVIARAGPIRPPSDDQSRKGSSPPADSTAEGLKSIASSRDSAPLPPSRTAVQGPDEGASVGTYIPVRRGENERGRESFIPVGQAAERRSFTRLESPRGAVDRPAPGVVAYDVESYIVLEGDNYDRIAQTIYKRSDLGGALAEYNRSSSGRRAPLPVGKRVLLPPVGVLTASPVATREPSARAEPEVVARRTAGSTPATEQPATAIGTTSAPSVHGPFHTVERAETLFAIAQKKLGDGKRWREIYQLNSDRLPNEYEIPVGVTLRLPENGRR